MDTWTDHLGRFNMKKNYWQFVLSASSFLMKSIRAWESWRTVEVSKEEKVSSHLFSNCLEPSGIELKGRWSLKNRELLNWKILTTLGFFGFSSLSPFLSSLKKR